jgi:PDZ domain
MEINQQRSAETNAQPLRLETVACPNCHAGLVRGMRFCRMCGYRLGEGLAEYTETMRFDGAMPPLPFARAPQTMPQAAQTTTLTPVETVCARRSGRGHRWLMWPLIVVLFASAGGGMLRRLGAAARWGGGGSIISPTRSFFGTEGFTTVDGGAMVDAALPNSPADRAGLVGGDIITSFDGQMVRTSEDMGRLLRATPIGKTVAIGYLRDGVAQTTTLATASSALYDQGAFRISGQPQGFLGVDNFDRVPVAGTNLYGVRVGQVIRNLPADIAGLHKGDIITEFDGTPIRTVGEFESRIHRAAPGQIVNVGLMRDGQQQTIPVKMGRR